MQFVLLAPGPSMSQAVADSVRGHRVGVINNCFSLAPWAEFLAATDVQWWLKYPEARQFAGRKFSPNRIGEDVERVHTALVTSCCNSGVLGLEVAKRLGATRVLLLGFDMGLGHFFGPYSNGLGNTTKERRVVHHAQFATWARLNKGIDVINCTPGSALQVFPKMELSEALA